MISRRGIADLVAAAKGAGRGGDLIGIVLEEAVGESPAFDVERDRLGLLEMAVVDGGSRLTELGLGRAPVVMLACCGGSGCGGLGAGFLDFLAHFRWRVVEEPPFHVEGVRLVSLALGDVVVARVDLLICFVQEPSSPLLGIDGRCDCIRASRAADGDGL